jgi:hypothetical protein
LIVLSTYPLNEFNFMSKVSSLFRIFCQLRAGTIDALRDLRPESDAASLHTAQEDDPLRRFCAIEQSRGEGTRRGYILIRAWFVSNAFALQLSPQTYMLPTRPRSDLATTLQDYPVLSCLCAYGMILCLRPQDVG